MDLVIFGGGDVPQMQGKIDSKLHAPASHARFALVKILFITRTFGPVGGMERYVFDTARELVLRGHEVTALCRNAAPGAAEDSGVKTVEIPTAPARRGWHDRYVFRDAVTEFFADPVNRDAFDIVHSHENTVEQHVSTEHGPCTAHGLRRAPWKLLDFSARKNLAIEKQKFAGPRLAALVSCAQRVQDIALREYPQLGRKITEVITPAYSYLQPVERTRDAGRRVLGFIGRDWKRKGLPKAIEAFRLLRDGSPAWTMLVAGCPAETLPVSLRNIDGVTLLGRADPQDFFGRIDVVIHPARDEPFGMVVSEALTCGVPVVASDQCGCNDHLETDGLHVLPVGADASAWASACSDAAGQTFAPIARRTWADVAVEHEELYKRVIAGRHR